MKVFVTILFIVVLLLTIWINWCTDTYCVGQYRDNHGMKHHVPLAQNVPIDYELQSVKIHIQITRGIGKGKSITI